MSLQRTGSTLLGHRLVFDVLVKRLSPCPHLITKENKQCNLRSILGQQH